jgi:hypothetical protein
VAIIRPVSLFIIGKIEAPAQVVWSHLKASGLRGVAFDCASSEGGAEFLGWASTLVRRARRAARSVLLYGLPTIEHAQALHEAGATHATLAH